MILRKIIERYFTTRKIKDTEVKCLNEGIILKVTPIECSIKVGTYYNEGSSSNMVSAFVRHFSNDNQEQIICCQIVVTKKILESDYHFISPIIPKNRKDIELLLELNNGFEIHVVSSDYSKYYFDLNFLYPHSR